MMNLRSKGLIFILSSPSGGGKSSLCKELLKSDSNLRLSVSATTRAPRSSEIEGVHYYFKTIDQFQQLINEDYFLEYARNYNNFYGTPPNYVKELINSGKDVLFDIDWKGVRQIKTKMPELVVSVFIMPPNLKVLKERLQIRGQDTEAVINYRMKLAEEEIMHANEYDYVVVNDNFDHALAEIKAILKAERAKNLTINKPK
jgi:guanylate kinase